MSAFQLFDVVVLTRDVPDSSLRRGDEGTIVHLLDGAYEVEFVDDDGATRAIVALRPADLAAGPVRPE